MKMQAYVDEIKLDVTGGILKLEIGDETIQQIVNSAMRELQRYICSTKLITIPYSKCIDMTGYKVNAITKVFRANSEGTTSDRDNLSTDPLQLSFYQLASGGNMYNFNDYISRYASWNTIQQISNTTSTDLAWYYEDAEKKLYINTTMTPGAKVSIEYVPRFDNVEEITSDYWIDILMKLSKALTKLTLGRIRGRYTQSNALWTSDAAQMLQDGQQELAEVRQHLQTNTQLIYPMD
jgi:hypothetical protein